MNRFRCPVCGRESSNPEDARQGYCGACHDWTGAGTDMERQLRTYGREWAKLAEPLPADDVRKRVWGMRADWAQAMADRARDVSLYAELMRRDSDAGIRKCGEDLRQILNTP